MRKLYKKIISIFFTLIAKLSCGKFNASIHVYGYSRFTKNTTFGKNVNFNGFKVYGSGHVHFGSNFHSGTNCRIINQVHNYEGNKIPYDETYIIKKVFIDDNVWIGNDVLILGGVTINEGAIIQAGSVVVNDIPELGIAGGHPAKVFKYRNKDHYYKLKSLKHFK